MASYLAELLDHMVCVITTDGRNIVGTLKGFDQTINIVLLDAEERVFSPEESVETVQLGAYIIRGDSIVLIGEVDESANESIDWSSQRGFPLPAIKHSVI